MKTPRFGFSTQYLIVSFLFLAVIYNKPLTAETESQISNTSKNAGVWHSTTLPTKVDNRNQFLRAPFEHLGHPCAFAASIAYNFTYEVNRLKNLPANIDDNLYPYIYGYHFYNGGSASAMCANFVDGYMLAMATGVPTNTAMGGFTAGYPTKWLDGYDKYYQAMSNRVVDYTYLDCTQAGNIQKIKQWVYDHGDGTTPGGLANFNVNSSGVATKTISSGSLAGKTLITAFGKSTYDHSLTIVGYDDNVSYDINGDGMITNNLDINRDGLVDYMDSESGAFIIMNSHLIWDSGFAYCLYSLFSTPYTQGGIGRNNQVYTIKVKKDIQPKFTLKATITHTSRSSIKVFAGISPDQNATTPTKVKNFAGAFNYAGGANPMEGKNLKSTIEIGLDVSDLVDSIGGKVGGFFLCVDSKSGGSGTVDKLSLMDYSGSTPKEYLYKDQSVSITGNIRLGGIFPGTPIKPDNSQQAIRELRISSISIAKKSNLVVAMNSMVNGKVRISLYDMTGKLVHSSVHPTVVGNQSLKFALGPLPTGVYRAVAEEQKSPESTMGTFTWTKRLSTTVMMVK